MAPTTLRAAELKNPKPPNQSSQKELWGHRQLAGRQAGARGDKKFIN